MKHLPPVLRTPANQPLLSMLEPLATPPKPPYMDWDIDEYELHCHPDLMERLEQVAADTQGRLSAAFGVPVLVHPNGIAFGFARGMWNLFLRVKGPVEDPALLPLP